VSILVPARNEEHCIEACVRSLLAQDYPSLEVLVLDDQGTDTTARIVQRLIGELPPDQSGRLQLLRGEALPTGWIGKSFACSQLALHAKGELLYFTDADTVHAPGTVRAVVDEMHHHQVQLLSAHPEYVFGSLGERLMVPLLNFSMLILLPLALVPRRPEPALSNGNGQLMCFQRSAYEQIGGHISVKDSLIEDVMLARLCKAAGHRMIFVDASTLVCCRMYRSFAEVVAGFSKNNFAVYHFALWSALLAITLMRRHCSLFFPSLVERRLYSTLPRRLICSWS
jgi:chlorobactene glucosyltransferase